MLATIIPWREGCDEACVSLNLSGLPNAVESLHSLSKDKMRVSRLWNTLASLNSNLNKDEFLAALNLVKVDGGYSKYCERMHKDMLTF